jgi:hypothetical protein
LQRAGFDAGVIGDDHAECARDAADAGDAAAAGHRLRRIGDVEQVTRERRKLQERRARIEQQASRPAAAAGRASQRGPDFADAACAG